MDNVLTLFLCSVLAFFLAWVLASWRSQRANQQTEHALETARADTERLLRDLNEHKSSLTELTQVKNNLDVAYGRLETELGSSKDEKERLQQESSSLQEKLEQVQNTERQLRESCARAEESSSKLSERLQSMEVNNKERIEEKEKQIHSLNEQLDALRAEHKATEKVLSQNREDLKQAHTQLDEKQQSLESYKSWWEQTKADLKQVEQKYSALSTEHSKLKTSLEEKQHHFDEQFKLLQHSKDALKKEFEHLAGEILERKGKAFKELNQESITNLLNPIHSEMKGFKSRVEELHTKDAEQRIQLTTELKHLQQLNKEITEQADKLATALQGQKKVQGNWGELILENVLDNSGLRLGVDYKREVSITTEDGRQRPDAVVYLPHNQHLIIDAKTSLVAYTEYVNADNELARTQALAAHAKAVSDRINELADKNYFKLPGLNSPEVVIMFIPIESAYVEALKHDETLFQRAIERNVLVATPTTLLTSLNIVRQLWRFEDQNKHTAELADRAEKFYNKLSSFLNSMQAIGTQLDKARQSYDKAFGQLYSGKGNLIKQAAEFKELGVAVQKELPAELVERANLELDGADVEDDSENSLAIANA